MPSLFDNVDDIEIPEEKPKREYKGFLKVAGIVLAVVVLGVGGYFVYQAMAPKRLVERPVPPNTEKLLAELKEVRDEIDSEARDIYARIEQFNNNMKMLGRKQVSFSQVFLQGLSAEEEDALDNLVRQEKDPSYRGILSQVVQDMKQIRELQGKVAELEALLPDEGIEVKSGDTHIKLAREYLIEEHGVPETRAKELVSRLNMMEAGLQKGFRVHFYYDPAKDFFGTWVSQGDSGSTPLGVIRARRLKLIEERDTAIARADDLEEKKVELEGVLAQLEDDIEALETRKANLESMVAQLEGEKKKALSDVKSLEEDLEVQRNSMFYEADLAERLRARGVLKMFNRVEGIGDVKFASSLNLADGKTITLKPSQFGIDQIRDVRIVPSFLKEGREIDVQFIDDGTVEVTVLNEDALRGQRVLFVVSK